MKIFFSILILAGSIVSYSQTVEKGPYTIYTINSGVYHIEDATTARPGGVTKSPDGTTTMNNCSDMYLVVGEKKALLIDLSNFLKYDNSASESLRELVYERAGERELLITITHLHGDHTGMLPAFKDDPRAKFWIPEAEFRGMNIFPAARVNFFPENASLDLGGVIINTTEVPGHTDHSTLFFIKGKNIVFTGDAIGSGSGVWIFNYESYLKYEKGIEKLVRYIEDPLNQVDTEKLIIYGGHYWQKGEVKDLTSQYIYDMKTLTEKLRQGTADAAAANSGRNYLDTNFKYGIATITWNKEDAAKLAGSLKKQ